MAHNGDIGSWSVADGYARNARPEPIGQIELQLLPVCCEAVLTTSQMFGQTIYEI